MVGNERIRDLALVIVARHGVEASFALARERARTWHEAGDDGWAAVWMRVAAEVREMLPGAQEEARSPAQPSLPELLNDPVMHAMLGDDEARRRDVVTTLRSAKRKLRR
jgi:hypothetical protein